MDLKSSIQKKFIDNAKKIVDATTKINNETESIKSVKFSKNDNIATVNNYVDQAMVSIRNIKALLTEVQELHKKDDTKGYNNLEKTLLLKYKPIFVDYLNAKTKFNDTYYETYKRRLRLIDNNISDEKIDKFIATQDKSLLSALVIADDTAQMEYTNAVQKAKQIDHLVRSIHELNQLFNDLNVLMSYQSDKLDNITINVEKAVVHIKKGNENLKNAQEKQKKNRKNYCIMCILLLIIIAIILGVSFPVLSSIGKL